MQTVLSAFDERVVPLDYQQMSSSVSSQDTSSYDRVLDRSPTDEVIVTTEVQPAITAESVGDDGLVPTSDHPVVFDRGGVLLTTSREVAAYFGKHHFHVIRDIENIIAQAGVMADPNLVKACFNVVNEPNPKAPNKLMRYIEMDERGVMILVGRFSGAKALEKQFAYAEEFRRMRELLRDNKPGVSIDAVIADPQSFVKLFSAYADLSRQVQAQQRVVVPEPVTPVMRAAPPRVLDVPRMRPLWPHSRGHKMQNDQDMSLSVAGHMVEMRSRAFIKALRDTGYLTSDNQPTPGALAKGLFRIKIGRGIKGKDYSQTMVTPLGLKFFRSHVTDLMTVR